MFPEQSPGTSPGDDLIGLGLGLDAALVSLDLA